MTTSLVEAAGLHGHGPGDLWGLLLHFLMLSPLAIGGAITTVADMHRYLVVEQAWLDDATFTNAIAIAQAAPGPNVLFVAVLGWQTAGLAGAIVTLTGMLAPSTALALLAARWGARHAGTRWGGAFKHGLAPVTIGLLLAAGWVLSEPVRARPGAWVLMAATVLVMLRSRVKPLWLIAAGGVAGAAGWV